MFPNIFSKSGQGSGKLAQEITEYVGAVRQLESIPSVALQVIDLAAKQDVARRDLSRLIETDPALAARVLRVANSAWAGLPGRVESLDRAMGLLGFEMVRNLALSVLISSLLYRSADSGRLKMRELWHHSLACSVACRELAYRSNFPEPTTAFVAGLLHDLGKIVLFRWNRELYERIVEAAHQKRVPLHLVEEEVLGLSHPTVGRMLLEDWNFPADLVKAVSSHHGSEAGKAGIDKLPTLVQAANCLCHHKRLGYSGHSHPDLTLQEVEKLAGLSPRETKEIAVAVVRRFDEVAALFASHDSTPELYLAAVARANQELSEMYQLLMERTREREHAEIELRRKEEQLNRSQRLEAVGQLAGGIAHDFNNFLTVIMGFGDLLREGLQDDSPLRQHADMIMGVAERAATLTRQLLAFSRRQVLKPKLVLLNSIVNDVQRLLVRLIGEDIKLTTVLEPNLQPIRVDPGGIEQVIVNLAVNARDAMMGGGTLGIETCNVHFSEEYADPFGRLPAGSYVMLKVSDSGHGMSRETQERIFEPFFTTKKRGTGMGLATVYGIVKQSGGHIFVESEVDKGTIFKVFFEPIDQPLEPEAVHPVVDAFEDGSETILIAEDEREILGLVEKILKNVGYNVLTAHNGEEALRVASDYGGQIHLLLTDAVMPVVNGRELVERLRPQRPNMKVLFMSGYTGTGILHRAVAGQDIAFLAKPFTPHELIKKVHDVLEATS